jgi:hypothetical protein
MEFKLACFLVERIARFGYSTNTWNETTWREKETEMIYKIQKIKKKSLYKKLTVNNKHVIDTSRMPRIYKHQHQLLLPAPNSNESFWLVAEKKEKSFFWKSIRLFTVNSNEFHMSDYVSFCELIQIREKPITYQIQR